MGKIVQFQDLGQKEYQQTWDYQESLLNAGIQIKRSNRRDNKHDLIPNYLLFVEHPHVYTLGKSGDFNNLLINQLTLQKINATFIKTNRGGDITYHGPEQIVGYPILDLEQFKTDINWYLRSLEEVIIQTIANYGLKGERSKGETGVWLDLDSSFPRKICAMGVRMSRWISMHGFALNVNTDLSYFQNIIPCGIQNKAVTSIQEEIGEKLPTSKVKEQLLQNFSKIFNVTLESTHNL